MPFCSTFRQCLPLLLLFCIVNLAFARQDPAIQLQQEIRQQQRNSEVRPTDKLSAAPAIPGLSSRPEDVPETTPVLDAPSISIESNDLLDDERIQQIVAPYQHLKLGKQRIALLLRQFNAQLVVQGLVTSRARIKRLDKQTNTLDIEQGVHQIQRLRRYQAEVRILARSVRC